ncbi:glutathione peroxidase-like [Mytilus californianus]|uniref:glutathione peroxidase-like n=1 Tax=Mytilus californianus TaxID=6549 RepID=UPI00224835E2|nr:glutathione peroxidase-like [Mytilus californianus]
MNCSQPSSSKENVYDYKAMDIMHELNISLSVFTNRILVITNTASFSGLTTPHYLGLNALKSKFDGQPFEILAFPCNNFELQEPADTGLEILNSLRYVRPGSGYIPNFVMMGKVNVNGANEHPLFTYLKKNCPPVTDRFEDNLFYSPLKNGDIRWNFEMFIIDKNGKAVLRYSSDIQPLTLVDTIQKYVNT